MPGDNVTNVATPTLTGTAEAGSTLTLFDGDAELGSTVADAAGNWSFDVPVTLTDGVHGITAVATDEAGNTGPASAALALTIDTVAQAISVQALVWGTDSGTVGDNLTNVPMPVFTGTAEANSIVRLLEGDTLLSSTTADPNGLWTIEWFPALSDDTHLLTFVATDAAGNSGSADVTITIDTQAPAAPLVVLDPASDSGLPGDDITHVAAPTLTGSAEPGSTVTLLDGATAIAAVTAGADGSWTFTPATPLGDGVHDITATATDAAGNTGAASAVLEVTIDTAAPGVSAPDLDPASDDGVPGDGVTSITTPVLIGIAEIGSTVTLFEGSTELGSTTANEAGEWSFEVTQPLNPGIHPIQAAATDAAGNTSALTVAFDLIIQGPVPDAPSQPVLDPGSDSGALGDNLTNVKMPTFNGSAAKGSTVTLFDGNTVLGTTTASDGDTWTFTPSNPLADGLHAITATATVAGTSSVASPPLEVTIDSTGPTLSGPVLDPGSDTGTPGDNQTSATTPTLTGTADAGSTVTFSEGSTVLGSALADGAGNWTFTPPAALANGPHTITATTAPDAAGNTSTSTLDLTIGPDAPAGPIDWSYNWAPGSVNIPATQGSGSLTLSNETAHRVTGNSDVVATNITTSSTASRGPGADQYINAPWVLSVAITDVASGATGTLTFTGTFNGFVSVASASVQIAYTSSIAQSIRLGGHTYTVTLSFYSPPGPPNSRNRGAIGAHVDVT